MDVTFEFSLGELVLVGGCFRGRIIAACITNTGTTEAYTTYRVIWWNDSARFDEWLEVSELTRS